MNRVFTRSGFAARLAAAAAVALLWGTAPASATHITFTSTGDDGWGDTAYLSGFIDVDGEGSNLTATAFEADFTGLPTGAHGFEQSAVSFGLDQLTSASWFSAANAAGPGFDAVSFAASLGFDDGDTESISSCGSNCVVLSDYGVGISFSFPLEIGSVTGATDVPEPASLALVLGGLAALGAARRKTPTV